MEMLKKGKLISLSGWLVLLLWSIVFADCLWGGFTLPHTTPLSDQTAAFLLLISFPALILWFAGTTLFHLRKNKLIMAKRIADLQAEANVKAQGTARGASFEDWMQEQKARGK